MGFPSSIRDEAVKKQLPFWRLSDTCLFHTLSGKAVPNKLWQHWLDKTGFSRELEFPQSQESQIWPNLAKRARFLWIRWEGGWVGGAGLAGGGWNGLVHLYSRPAKTQCAMLSTPQLFCWECSIHNSSSSYSCPSIHNSPVTLPSDTWWRLRLFLPFALIDHLSND